MVVSGELFYSIVDHSKMTESILQVFQAYARRMRQQGEFRGHTRYARDFRGLCGTMLDWYKHPYSISVVGLLVQQL